MSSVTVKINGRDYVVACDDGQEEHLRLLADEVDERLQSLVFQMKGNPGEAMGLLLTALMMADELIENKKENDDLRAKLEQMQHSPAAGHAQDARIIELEAAMAGTLQEIANRIERIADQVETNAV